MVMGACSSPSHSGLSGRASVIDGDTLEIHGQRVRLWGIDAPEASQSCEAGGASYRCGVDAARALDRWLKGRPVNCNPLDRDRYQRIVARCSVDRTDIGAWLVTEGLAVRYVRYAGTAYRKEEDAARAARRGVWQGEFEAPWDWRRERGR
ncbi:thermonuclease family protein [Pseudomonas sp. FW305-3-2-15-E-TSA4]|nr:thermonuclease family protein [Pseudomonas sp. FW305-3-2-15-E-TSA4]